LRFIKPWRVSTYRIITSLTVQRGQISERIWPVLLPAFQPAMISLT
jgi:hypothetical protein